jgi:hypothetical protein
MNELESLPPIVLYALSIAILAALLGRLLDGTDGPSLASLIGGEHELPWPHGVQEEEPVRWHVEALRPWRDQRPAGVTRTALDRPCSVGPGPRSCQAVRPGA